MPARRRSATVRKPRVAGLAPARRSDDEAPDMEVREPGGTGSDQVTGPDDRTDAAAEPDAADPVGTTGAGTGSGAAPDAVVDPADTDPADTDPVDTDPALDTGVEAGADTDQPAAEPVDPESGKAADTGPRRTILSRLRALPVLVGALAVFVGLGAFFAIQDHSVRNSPSASNTALVDVGATAEAASQVGAALETIYSYDHTRLDQNEQAARAVITPAFGAQFDTLFGQVRELAPQQQAVVTATVTLSAVQSIEGDRAVLVAFLDQQATRATPDPATQQLTAAGRLTVAAERVDGRWKIADVRST